MARKRNQNKEGSLKLSFPPVSVRSKKSERREVFGKYLEIPACNIWCASRKFPQQKKRRVDKKVEACFWDSVEEDDDKNMKTHHPLRLCVLCCVSVRLKHTTYVNRLRCP